MDLPPPAIHQSVLNIFKSDFIDFMKNLENANFSGYKNGKWYPHRSYEGGYPTIAWGHKIKTKSELHRFNNGISTQEAERLLKDDLEEAKQKVDDYIESLGVKIPLNQKQVEMLTEFMFNLGNLRGFPKFTKAVLNQDWKTAEKECIRYANGKPIPRRNELFKQRYFK